jgi:hypothetical protein
MGEHATEPALAFLLAPNKQTEQATRNAGSGKSAQAARSAERLPRGTCQIHLTSRRAAGWRA